MNDMTILDQMYLELSQFTLARTQRELVAELDCRTISIILGRDNLSKEEIAEAKSLADATWKSISKYTEI